MGKGLNLRPPVLPFIAILCPAALIGPLQAQTRLYSISGRVMEAGTSYPIPEALVRLSSGSSRLTDSGGRFSFEGVRSGRNTLTVEALGYRRGSLALDLRADTTLVIGLQVDPIVMDSLLVEAKEFTLQGRARDATTGVTIPSAHFEVWYEGADTVQDAGGFFRVKDLPRAVPVHVRAGAYRYRPADSTVVARGDTTVDFHLEPDSVGIRMFELAAEQLADRASGLSLSRIYVPRDYFENRLAVRLVDLIRSRSGSRFSSRCFFIDEQPESLDVLNGYLPEDIEAVEIYGRGAMVRVYTQKFIAQHLTRIHELPPPIWGPGGVCH